MTGLVTAAVVATLVAFVIATTEAAFQRMSRARAHELLEEGRPARADLADDRDHRPLRADVVERGQTLGQDPALDAEDLRLAGTDCHHDEHRGAVSSSIGRAAAISKVASSPSRIPCSGGAVSVALDSVVVGCFFCSRGAGATFQKAGPSVRIDA